MLIRDIRSSDIAKLQAMQEGLDWSFGPEYVEGLVAVDENDDPIMAAGAWKIAEVHCALDRQWSTPGARMLMLKELHAAMEERLRRQGIRQVVTWFDGAKDRFRKRLECLGWIESQKKSWHRRING